jgi:hypothetical protein
MQNVTETAIKAVLSADASIDPATRARIIRALTDPAPAPTGERIVRRAEVARKYSCSIRTVDNLTKQGLLKRIVLPGRGRGAGFRESDVLALIGGR